MRFSPTRTQPAISPEPVPLQAARRPVLDRNLRTVGYELRVADPHGPAWQGELLSDTHPAYLNVDRRLLLSAGPMLPPQPGGVILAITDESPADGALLDALRGLRAQGRAIVLDDMVYQPALEPFLELADIVKLQVDGPRRRQALGDAAALQRPNLKLLAEGVDSEDAYTVFRDAGFDLFEGLFYEHARPRASRGPAVGARALDTLAQLEAKGGDFDALDAIIRRDIGLSYRLLRYVNSAFVGLPRTLGSVREALSMLGTRAVRQWAVALVLTGLDNRPHALLSTALVRARTCETLVRAYAPESADQGFTAGLFSLLDAILEAPMPEVLAALPLTVDVKAAILGHDGPLGHALEKAIAYGRGDFDAPALAGHARIALAIAYSDAVQWVDGLL